MISADTKPDVKQQQLEDCVFKTFHRSIFPNLEI